MISASAIVKPKKTAQAVKTILGVGVGVFLLLRLFRDTSSSSLTDALAAADHRFFLPVVAAMFLTHWVRALAPVPEDDTEKPYMGTGHNMGMTHVQRDDFNPHYIASYPERKRVYRLLVSRMRSIHKPESPVANRKAGVPQPLTAVAP